jgi:hypothetical protein
MVSTFIKEVSAAEMQRQVDEMINS